MPRPPGSAKTPGSGRKPGSPNKNTKEAKESLMEVFERLGGADAMLAWAQSGNETEFYRIWSKILPRDVTAKIDGEVRYVMLLPQPAQNAIEWKKQYTQTIDG